MTEFCYNSVTLFVENDLEKLSIEKVMDRTYTKIKDLRILISIINLAIQYFHFSFTVAMSYI